MASWYDALRRRVRGGTEPLELVVHEDAPPAYPAAPADPLLFAVGDVHGMGGLFEGMLDAIAGEADRLGRPATVVFLGDVVNRGPDTRKVIERLTRGPSRACDRWVTLMGNHEVLMLEALSGDDVAAFERWLRRGGIATLKSYGLSRREMTRSKALKAVDGAHLAFLQALPVWHLAGDVLCVHAGVKPNVPLERQDPHNLVTIRGRFLTKPHGLPYTVVHGHTPTGGLPEVAGHRINVDTGAVHSGILTAAVFEGDGAPVRFLRVMSS